MGSGLWPDRNGPRPHRSDPKGFSYVTSYAEQRKENESLRLELEHAQALLQIKANDLRQSMQHVEELEREEYSKTQRIQRLQHEVKGLEAKEGQLASAVQHLSKSGEHALLVLHHKKEEHETARQLLGQLEVSLRLVHKTVIETHVVITNQERQLQQQRQAHEQEVGKLSARVKTSERELDVLREKQHALCETLAEQDSKDAQLRMLEVKLQDTQNSVNEWQAQLKEAQEMTRHERVSTARALERVQAEFEKMQQVHTRELQIAADEHMSVSNKVKEAKVRQNSMTVFMSLLPL